MGRQRQRGGGRLARRLRSADAGREAARTGPRDLRSLYLDTLKLALLDLGGTATGRVLADAESHEIIEIVDVPVDNPERQTGADWPARGLTMIGRQRLDQLQEAVETVVREGVEGDLIEAGVWRGGASMLMKAVLEAYGDETRRVVVADSFTGVPKPKVARDAVDDLYRFSYYLGVPRSEVQMNFARYGLLDKRVEFVKGLFEKTMPRLRGRRWSVIRLDGDLYESLMPPLECLYDGLSPGGFLIVDDAKIPQAMQAVVEFRERMGITEPMEPVDEASVYWRKATTNS
ncbi:MAG: TylF/MycF family methyltransferase [Actinomycetota bacterium]|nr:TylF/MycF family methyltransferase [Actinomycetota bacterium]